jgi:hypothetical protein
VLIFNIFQHLPTHHEKFPDKPSEGPEGGEDILTLFEMIIKNEKSPSFWLPQNDTQKRKISTRTGAAK